MFTGLHAKYPLFWLILMKLVFSQQIFEKYSNIKFHETSSSGSRDVLCGQADTMNPIIAFHNFVNAPKNVLNLTWDVNYFLSVLFLMCHTQKPVRSAEMYQTACPRVPPPRGAMDDTSHQHFRCTKFKPQ